MLSDLPKLVNGGARILTCSLHSLVCLLMANNRPVSQIIRVPGIECLLSNYMIMLFSPKVSSNRNN